VIFGFFHDKWEQSLPPEQRADLAAERQRRAEAVRRGEEERKQEQIQKQEQLSRQQQTAQSLDAAQTIAALMTNELHEKGSDVKVTGLRDILMFDCTEALDPRTTCYLLYKRYPQNKSEWKLLRTMGIRTLLFQADTGLFKGPTWSKDL
jgi:hypothetical protein